MCVCVFQRSCKVRDRRVGWQERERDPLAAWPHPPLSRSPCIPNRPQTLPPASLSDRQAPQAWSTGLYALSHTHSHLNSCSDCAVESFIYAHLCFHLFFWLHPHCINHKVRVWKISKNLYMCLMNNSLLALSIFWKKKMFCKITLLVKGLGFVGIKKRSF